MWRLAVAGARAVAAWRGALGEPDPYCPIVRGEQRRLTIRQAAAREMPKLESACTTIVIARD